MSNKVSFVIPCYRSEHTLVPVINEIKCTMKLRSEIKYEIICISDASPDGVYNIIKELAKKDKHIIGVELLKNFGQHAALMAGYRLAGGDIVVSVDDDGQVPVNEVFKLLDKLNEGYDVVYGSYEHKQHNIFRNLGSLINRIMAECLIGQPRHMYVTSFFVMRKKVVNSICEYTRPYVYVAGLILRVTKKIATIPVHHRRRLNGKSGYTLHKLIALWLNGFTVFSVKPLRIASFLGGISSLSSFIYMLYIILQRVYSLEAPMGWSSLIASIFLIGGLILMVLGIIGEYIGRIYMCINEAPQYVIRCTTMDDM